MKSFSEFRKQLEEQTIPKTAKEKELAALGHPKDKITHKDVLIGRGVLKKEEAEQVEGMHYCAKHVYSEELGEGFVVEGEHAEPDENGQISWYMVEFADGVYQVDTEDVQIMFAEYHMNHKMKKEAEECGMEKEKEGKEKEKEGKEMKEASYSAKAASAGKDIGKPGKMFGKIAASAAKRYGSEAAGKRVAGSVLAKLRQGK